MTLTALRSRYPSTTLQAGDFSVELVRSGPPGQPLLLLPGAQGNCETFCKQLLAFGDRRDVVSVTYPAVVVARDIATMLLQVADALGWRSFDLLGTSLGGHVAQWMAALDPNRVRRLMIANSFSNPAPVKAPDRLARLLESGAHEIKSETVERIKAGPESELRAIQLELIGNCQPAHFLKSRLLAVQLAVDVPEIRKAPAEVAVLDCEDDPIIPKAVREETRARYAGSKVYALGRGGHFPYITNPEAYDRAVAEFFEIPPK